MPPLRTNKQVLNHATTTKLSDTRIDSHFKRAPKDVPAKLTAEDLQDEDKDALIARIIILQDQLEKAVAQAVPEPTSTSVSVSTPKLTPEQLSERVNQVRNMMVKGITSQMKVTHQIKKYVY
jgi:hypothetical protein